MDILPQQTRARLTPRSYPVPMDDTSSGAYPAHDLTPARRGLPGCLWAALGATVVLALLLLATLAFSTGLLKRPSFLGQETVDRTGPSVLQQLEDIQEFHAATGYFETVVDLERDTENLPQWVSGERVLYVGKGEVDAVVDFSGIQEQDVEVSEDRRTIDISLPAPTLDEPTLDLETSYVVDHDRGITDRFTGSDIERRAQRTAVEQMIAAAEGGDTGMVERAETNTTAMLEALFTAAEFETVEVTFAELAG